MITGHIKGSIYIDEPVDEQLAMLLKSDRAKDIIESAIILALAIALILIIL